MKIQAVIPMAGAGTRFKSAVPKTLGLLNGKPLFLYSLEAFASSPSVESIIVVVPQAQLKEFQDLIRKQNLKKIAHVVVGGETRRDSVFNGLQKLEKGTQGVLIHDGVRPFVTVELIEQIIKELKKHKAVIAAVPVKPTIKKVDPKSMQVVETIERENVWEVQTPQAFHKETILEAHQRFGKRAATDDAMMVEQLGVPVTVVMGDYKNIKITTPEDLTMAEALI